MVVALNLLVALVCLLGAVVWWKTKNAWYLLATVGFMILYMQVQPSYMPKGEVKRTSVPSLEASSDAAIEDRNRKPVDPEVRQSEQERQYREGPVFLQQ